MNDELHREDGPAVEDADGSREWWVNGVRHREDGPAVEDADGSRKWYQDGKLHRTDGPAQEWADGRREWWVNGKQQFDPSLSPEERRWPDEVLAARIADATAGLDDTGLRSLGTLHPEWVRALLAANYETPNTITTGSQLEDLLHDDTVEQAWALQEAQLNIGSGDGVDVANEALIHELVYGNVDGVSWEPDPDGGVWIMTATPEAVSKLEDVMFDAMHDAGWGRERDWDLDMDREREWD